MKKAIAIEGFDNIITEAVEKQIQLSIVEALEGATDGIVERIVKTAMYGKVKDGYNNVPFFEKLAKDTIQSATQEAMREWIAENGPTIRAELEKQIGTAKFKRSLAASMLSALTDRASSPYWRVNVEYTLDNPND